MSSNWRRSKYSLSASGVSRSASTLIKTKLNHGRFIAQQLLNLLKVAQSERANIRAVSEAKSQQQQIDPENRSGLAALHQNWSGVNSGQIDRWIDRDHPIVRQRIVDLEIICLESFRFPRTIIEQENRQRRNTDEHGGKQAVES